MIEKIPKDQESKESKRRGLRLGGALKGLFGRREPKYDYVAQQAENYARQRTELDKIPAGPGLKGYDLELNSFRNSEDMSQLTSIAPAFYDTCNDMLEEYRAAHPESRRQSETEQEDDPFIALMYSGVLRSGATPELNKWIYENTPQNGYFTPEMIESAVANDPEFAVEKTREGEIDVWRFSNQEGDAFTLSRSADGQRPSAETKPYLGAKYWSEYDPATEEVVSSPRLSSNGYHPSDRQALESELGDKLMQHLNLHPVRTPQKIDFRVVGTTQAPYFTAPEKDAFESITAEAHVVADLPKVA